MNYDNFFEVYLKIFQEEFEGKQIWEHIRDKYITATSCFIGESYESGSGLMVVGRAMNGWEMDFGSCADLDLTVKGVLSRTFDFEDVVNKNGIPYTDEAGNSINNINGKPKKYFYSRSAFWRLIRKVLEENGETDNWHKRIAWSNLYKLSPRKEGNPNDKLIKLQTPYCVAILKKEIELLKPARLLFITDIEYFKPFEESFKLTEKTDSEYINKSGTYQNSRVIVCVRPEGRKTTEMASEIYKEFVRLENSL